METRSPTGWRHARALVMFLSLGSLLSLGPGRAQASVPGGFVENAGTAEVRPLLTAAEIQALLPSRGPFTFPAPYGTAGVRLTNSTDCAGSDCVYPVGYSYWRNINNHAGSNSMYIFLGLKSTGGGAGPTLFTYDKVSEQVVNAGPLFAAGSKYRGYPAEGWYFSATLPTALYLNDGAKMLRYDVVSKQFTTVYDAAPQFGSDKYIWQMHSSDDDHVHIATLRALASGAMLGCLAYRSDTAQFQYYPAVGTLDECHVDHSGRWLLMLEDVDGMNQLDNRIIDLQTGSERTLLDQNGALGHADMGYGYMVGEDDWNSQPGAAVLWPLDQDPLQDALVYQTTDWAVDMGHVSHTNAKPGAAAGQYACNSRAGRANLPRGNEVVCYPLDGSLRVLVVAPVMTNLDAAGGGDDYSKSPKGNLDVTGRYFIWTSNLGGSRLDAFLVKVPGELLTTSGADTTAPAVTATSPTGGATLTGTTTLAASTSDNVGVIGVQWRLDGANLGPEVLVAPFNKPWNTTLFSNAPHTLAAVARDAAGNSTTSSSVAVRVGNLTAIPGEVSPPSAAQPLRFLSSQILVWEAGAPSGSLTFKVYRGTTTGLAAGQYGACLRNGLTVATATDTETPPSGVAWTYLVTGKNTLGEGSLGKRSSGATRANTQPCS